LARRSLPLPGAGTAHPRGPAERRPGGPGAFRHRGSSKTTASGPGSWPRTRSPGARGNSWRPARRRRSGRDEPGRFAGARR